jgi:hypothetical protein
MQTGGQEPMLTTRCSDAFTKREKAAEEMWIKEEERKKYVSSPRPECL